MAGMGWLEGAFRFMRAGLRGAAPGTMQRRPVPVPAGQEVRPVPAPVLSGGPDTDVMPVVPEGYARQGLELSGTMRQTVERAAAGGRCLCVPVVRVGGGEIFVMLARDAADQHLYGVMTPEEFDERQYAGYEGFTGVLVDVVVTGWENARGMARVSRRRVREAKRAALLPHLQPGRVLTGVVRAFQSCGAFVDIGGLHAILPVNEISHSFVRHPSDVLLRGEAVTVKLLSWDPATGKARVSRKALVDPWDKASEVYARGVVVTGTVSGVKGEHLWVRPDPHYGLEILCPALPERTYEIGAAVRVRLVTADRQANKLRGRVIGFLDALLDTADEEG